MTDDIVTRLRAEVAKTEVASVLPSWELAKCMWEAADEIERLRAERLEWFLVARQLRDAAMAAQEIDEAINNYLRVRGRLEDPRDAAEEASNE